MANNHEKKQKLKAQNKTRLTVDEEAANAKLARLEAEMQLDNAPLAVPTATSFSLSESRNPFATHATSKRLMVFWGVVIVGLILSKLPFSDIFFAPLNQFATMVHEMGHALMCLMTGGHVSGMTIVADGAGHGGLTRSSGGIRFLVTQAGYLGTAFFGCMLVYLSQFHKLSRGILIGLGSIMGLASVFFMAPAVFSSLGLQALGSMVWALVMGGMLIYAGLKLKDSNANLVLMFIAVYTAMDSLRAISIVLLASLMGSAVTSDATFMQQNYFLPAIFWSLLWATLSAVMLAVTIWFTYGFGVNKKLPKISGNSLLKLKKK